MASEYPNGFRRNISIRGVPIVQTHPGTVWWVYNGTSLVVNQRNGSDGNPGTFNAPFATIQQAINSATANRGDIIFVKPGHTETLTGATGLVLNKAGIAVVGLGQGSLRPTWTYGAAAANVPCTAANVIVSNFLLVANFADVVSAFTATGTATPTDLVIDNCEFRDTASNKNFLTAVTGNATANSMDGLTFTNNKVFSLGTTAATTAIVLASASARVTVNDNFFDHAVLNDTASILATGANNVLNFEMSRNKATKPNTSSTGGSFVSTSGTGWTGLCADNQMYQLDNSAGIWIATGTKLGFVNNYSPITGAADKSALINPAAV